MNVQVSKAVRDRVLVITEHLGWIQFLARWLTNKSSFQKTSFKSTGRVRRMPAREWCPRPPVT